MKRDSDQSNRPPRTREERQAMCRLRLWVVSEVRSWGEGSVRLIGDKTFYLHDGYWVDASYQTSAATIKIHTYSEEYFALARRLGASAAYLSFAERIILVWEGKAYQIEPEK